MRHGIRCADRRSNDTRSRPYARAPLPSFMDARCDTNTGAKPCIHAHLGTDFPEQMHRHAIQCIEVDQSLQFREESVAHFVQQRAGG